jgi:hypothetical protein
MKTTTSMAAILLAVFMMTGCGNPFSRGLANAGGPGGKAILALSATLGHDARTVLPAVGDANLDLITKYVLLGSTSGSQGEILTHDCSPNGSLERTVPPLSFRMAGGPSR